MSKGLLSYLETGKITQPFLVDFNNLCNKIYRHWSLPCSLEDFQGFCTEKLIYRISGFDASRGNIQNYVYNLILNEARRLYSAGTHESNTDMEVVRVYAASGDDAELLARKLWDFAIYAHSKGIYINQSQVLSNYQCSHLTPAVKAFLWFIHSRRV